MVSPSCAVSSRSMTIVDCGRSYLKSLSTKMNMPLFWASWWKAEATSNNRLKLGGRGLALAPGLQHHAAYRLPRNVELEHVVGLRVLHESLVHNARVQLPLLQRRVGRGLRSADDDALVLGRREFGLCRGVEEIDASED